MRRRAPARAAVAVLGVVGALVAVLALAAAPAGAVGAAQVGFWWVAGTGQTPPPPTDQVPANGLWVSSNPTGPQAVSAIRFDLGDGETAPTLTLKVHSKSGNDPILMAACPTDGAWQPTAANAGTWGSRPVSDCSTSAGGIVNGDGSAVTFDLASLVKGTRVDVAFVPLQQAGPVPVQPPVTVPPTTVPALPSPLPTVPTTLPAAVPVPPPPSTSQTWPTFDATFEAITPDTIAVTSTPVATTIPDYASGPAPVFGSTNVAATASPATNFFSAPPETTPPPTTTPPATVPFRRAAAPNLPVNKSKGRSAAQRIALAVALALLVGMSTNESRPGGAARKPRLSIYDPPPSRELIQAPVRVGKPPPVR